MVINGYVIKPRADLRGADLRGADLRWANLRGADLRWANLRGANLRWANLRWADLQEADLQWADLQEANLRGANLQRTDLKNCIGNSKEIITLQFCPWNVVIHNKYVSIGCHTYTIKQWMSMSKNKIKILDSNAEHFSEQWGDIIRSILLRYEESSK